MMIWLDQLGWLSSGSSCPLLPASVPLILIVLCFVFSPDLGAGLSYGLLGFLFIVWCSDFQLCFVRSVPKKTNKCFLGFIVRIIKFECIEFIILVVKNKD